MSASSDLPGSASTTHAAVLETEAPRTPDLPPSDPVPPLGSSERAQELGGRAAPLSSPECVVRSPEVSSRPRSPPINSWNHWRKPTVHLVEELEPMFAHPTEGFMRGFSSVDTVVRVVHVQEADVKANCNP